MARECRPGGYLWTPFFVEAVMASASKLLSLALPFFLAASWAKDPWFQQVDTYREPEAAPYRLSRMRAQLFYSDHGTFSRNILPEPGSPPFELFNVITGEGSAEGDAEATLVVVEVTGEPHAFDFDGSVELTATVDGRVTLRQAVVLMPLSDRGRFFAAFWLYDTGCRPVYLSARLVGRGQPSTLRAEIPFLCEYL